MAGCGAVKKTVASLVTVGLVTAGAALPARAATPPTPPPPEQTSAATVEDYIAKEMLVDRTPNPNMGSTAVSENVIEGGTSVTVQDLGNVKRVEAVKEPEPGINAAPVAVGTSLQVSTGYPNQTVFGNLTAVSTVTGGHTKAWPCDEPRPNASVNNYVPGLNATPNFVAVKTDSTGHACFYSSGQADIMWDQYGATNTFIARSAYRIFDTRTTGTRVPANTVYVASVGAPGQTIMGNLTVTQPAGAGHTTVYPCDQPRPTASVNNFVAGETTPNFTIATADANGQICFYTTSTTHLIWDQVVETFNGLPAHTANRLLDTRNTNTTPLPAGSVAKVTTKTPNTAVFGNLTVTQPAAPGYTTLWDCAANRPLASVNNYVAGETTPNFATVKTNSTGEFCIYTSSSAHLIWDQTGETSGIKVATPTRLLDTRQWGGGSTAANEDSHWSALTTVPSGKKVRWNPCEPAIKVLVNNGLTGGAEHNNLMTAIERVRNATGLPLIFGGYTSTIPTRSNNSGLNEHLDPARNLVFSFVTRNETDIWSSPYALGMSGTSYYSFPNSTDYWHFLDGKATYGYVVIDQNAIRKYSDNVRTITYMHELAHAVGMGHYDDTKQIMNPMITGNIATWGRGDLHGLSYFGLASGCLPTS